METLQHAKGQYIITGWQEDFLLYLQPLSLQLKPVLYWREKIYIIAIDN